MILRAYSPSPSRCHRRRAFTLVELLAVIAIIGVLAAILIPTVGSVRESARATQCRSNMRQLGIAVLQHAIDNRGQSLIRQNVDPAKPEGDRISWWQIIQNRLEMRFPTAGVENLFLCPGTHATFSVPPRRTYALNLAGGDDLDPIIFLRISSPARAILLVETRQSGAASPDGFSVVGVGSIERDEFSWHHRGGMHVTMADGSQRTLRRNDANFGDLLRNIRR